MREIKFRAWDGDTMHYNGVIIMDDESSVCLNGCIDCDDAQPVADIMQFTGLNDKNGKEIYEGDIVRLENTKWLFETVDWKKLSWWLGEYMLSDYNPQDLEIIGNIYDNPELTQN